MAPTSTGSHTRSLDESSLSSPYHVPVLVEAVLRALTPLEPGVVLDATVGGGGHARRILERFPDATVLGSDMDADALAAASSALEPFGRRVRLVQARADEIVDRAGLSSGSLSGALLDLGVSSHQLDDEGRGFSFRRGVRLDMRMDAGGEQADGARAVLASASEEDLTYVFRTLAEEPRGRALARAVCRRREREPLETSDDLVAALASVLGRSPTAREKARVFQGLRMAVNREWESLKAALVAIRDALRSGGTFCVISYHSHEDREVKHAFREWSRDCVCPPDFPVCACSGVALGRVLTPKPIYPEPAEVDANPRARSARMRAWRAA